MTQCAAAVDQIGFRSIMARFATGVTVITSTGAAGPAGMTANAVASLSLDPLLVMAGFDLRSRTLTAVRQSRRFAVNVLASDQEQISRIFAGKQPEPEKFTACAYRERSGLPVIAGALAWLTCRVTAIHPGGDHVIVVGSAIEMGGDGGEPLLFYGGRYHRLNPGGLTGPADLAGGARPPAHAAGTAR
jgi:flavin reductase (DIM6/NTAB) family NADH-FMN oxidoreductase RutF